YSLHASIRAVLNFLAQADPAGAARARERYSCFDHFGHDPQTYGYEAGLGLTDSCQQEAIDQLREMHRLAFQLAQADGKLVRDEAFWAQQNAAVVKDAEQYYRAMFHTRISSWNLR